LIFEAYFAAFLLGLSVAAPIGPVNVEIIRRGLRIGFIPAFFLGCGAVSADCIYLGLALVATQFMQSIRNSPVGMGIIFFLGGALLIWIGIMSVRSRAHLSEDAHEAVYPSRHTVMGSYLFGLAMTLTNPMTIIFWLSIASTFTAGGSHGSPGIVLAGVFSGTISWVTFIVSLTASARRWVTPKFLKIVNVVSGLCLIGFGLAFWIRIRHPLG